MPRMIVTQGSALALTYKLTMGQSLRVEAISCDLDTTGVGPAFSYYCDAIYKDQAGNLIARSRSSKTIPASSLVTMTFAPWLPDTQELGNAFVDYVNTTGLCATTLSEGASVTVQMSETPALVTEMRLWAEDQSAGVTGDALGDLGAFILVPGPQA